MENNNMKIDNERSVEAKSCFDTLSSTVIRTVYSSSHSLDKGPDEGGIPLVEEGVFNKTSKSAPSSTKGMPDYNIFTHICQ
ncbi:MAG: hypothetical protein ACI88H_003822 [Cocleimonas sp.]|jgi:hypothetical protein